MDAWKPGVDPLPGVRDAAMARFNDARAVDTLKTDAKRSYEMRVFMAAAELKDLFGELDAALALLHKATTFAEISALLKLYIINWSSLSDLLAIVLNEVFALGIAAQDISLGAILRNAHIRTTEVPQIVKKYGKATQYDRFVRMRNDIVHRGKLDDDELTQIHSDLLMEILARSGKDIVENEDAKATMLKQARRQSRVRPRITELIKSRENEYREQMTSTQAMLREIAEVLIRRVEAQEFGTA
jgi:hypothetical protein